MTLEFPCDLCGQWFKCNSLMDTLCAPCVSLSLVGPRPMTVREVQRAGQAALDRVIFERFTEAAI